MTRPLDRFLSLDGVLRACSRRGCPQEWRNGDQVRVFLRRRQGRRQCEDAGRTGGQGCQPGRDDQHRAAGPAGFTIGTEVCNYFYANGKQYPPELAAQVDEAMAKVEKAMGKKFGDTTDPLLVSCRSGARDSMPGMMDTVLNIGLNDTTVAALAKASGNERFAWDSYRRFVQMYGDVVLGMKPEKKTDIDPFEHLLEEKKHKAGVKFDSDLSVAQLKELVAEFKAAIKSKTGKEFPNDPKQQVWGAIGAVFGSWMNDRAIVYRRTYGIPTNGEPPSTCRRWCSATWVTTAPRAWP